MNICLYGSSSDKIDKRFLDEAFSLGAKIAERGHTLVFGSGNTGVMGACARGVSSQNGRLIGIAPRFFDTEGVLYKGCTELIYTDTMRERKQLMEDSSDAFIMAAGGIGTFDEFFEILTLKQLGRHKKPIAVFNVLGYFDPLRAMVENAIQGGFADRSVTELFSIHSDADRLLDYLGREQ